MKVSLTEAEHLSVAHYQEVYEDWMKPVLIDGAFFHQNICTYFAKRYHDNLNWHEIFHLRFFFFKEKREWKDFTK